MFKKGVQVILLACLNLMVIGCQIQPTHQEDLSATQAALQTSIAGLNSQIEQNAQNTAISLARAEQTLQAQQTLVSTLRHEATPPAATPALETITPSPSSSLSQGSRVKEAKILLYESMSGQRIYGIYPIRYIRQALDFAGITYVDVGSAQGWFYDKLVSSEEWDLIIASSEANSSIQGEFAKLLFQRVQKGSALILEIWDLDQVRSGEIRHLLELCGVEFYADLRDLQSLAMFPLIPDHPVFNVPNQGIRLNNTSLFWYEDNGDLLKISENGAARLLAGTLPERQNDHGVIAECLGGRMILQSFRSHDLALLDSQALWQNYVYYVLRE